MANELTQQEFDANIELLTPGSVWKRGEGADLRQVRVLLVTNITLSEKAQEAHPIQVVYVNSEDAQFNRNLHAFFKAYDFSHVDPTLEKRLEGLLAPEVSDATVTDETVVGESEAADATVEDGDDFDFAAGLPTDDGDEETEEETEVAPTVNNLIDLEPEDESDDEEFIELAPTVDEAPIQFDVHRADLPIVLKPETVAALTLEYSVRPYSFTETTATMLHEIIIATNDEVTLVTLRESFRVANEDTKALLLPIVDGTVIEWNECLGVYQKRTRDGNSAIVLLTTEIDLVAAPVAEAPTEVSEGIPAATETIEALQPAIEGEVTDAIVNTEAVVDGTETVVETGTAEHPAPVAVTTQPAPAAPATVQVGVAPAPTVPTVNVK